MSKSYPSIVQSAELIPTGFVRACTLYDGKTKEGVRLAARISGLVRDGLIHAYKLAPAMEAKATPPSAWPLYVNPEHIERENALRDKRKALKSKAVPAVVSIDRPSTAVAEAFASLAGELTLLRQEMQAMRQALVAVESALIDSATRPAEEVTA